MASKTQWEKLAVESTGFLMQTEFLTTHDPRWSGFLKGVRHDFYHLPSYLQFCARHEGGTARAFYAKDGDVAFLAPMLVRPLPPELGAPPDWTDAITPYGYPSPLVSGPASPQALARVIEAFRERAIEQGVVSAFFRLHPLLPLPIDEMARHGTLLQHHGTVVIDLTQPLEELERQTRSDHRADIRKLKKAGFTVTLDDWDRMDDFIRLYIGTMNRVGAQDFYFFSEEYFRDLRRTLGADRLHLCTVLAPDGNVACSAMFTAINNDIIQGHLGGTADAYRRQAPFKLVIDFIRQWGKKAGYRCMNLGGGVGNRDDSLFRFKAGFSPVFKAFHTYRLILDDERYAKLNEIWERKACGNENGTGDFFPLYRRPLAMSEG